MILNSYESSKHVTKINNIANNYIHLFLPKHNYSPLSMSQYDQVCITDTMKIFSSEDFKSFSDKKKPKKQKRLKQENFVTERVLLQALTVYKVKF